MACARDPVVFYADDTEFLACPVAGRADADAVVAHIRALTGVSPAVNQYGLVASGGIGEFFPSEAPPVSRKAASFARGLRRQHFGDSEGTGTSSRSSSGRRCAPSSPTRAPLLRCAWIGAGRRSAAPPGMSPSSAPRPSRSTGATSRTRASRGRGARFRGFPDPRRRGPASSSGSSSDASRKKNRQRGYSRTSIFWPPRPAPPAGAEARLAHRGDLVGDSVDREPQGGLGAAVVGDLAHAKGHGRAIP